jgi:hypothetical protein
MEQATCNRPFERGQADERYRQNEPNRPYEQVQTEQTKQTVCKRYVQPGRQNLPDSSLRMDHINGKVNLQQTLSN